MKAQQCGSLPILIGRQLDLEQISGKFSKASESERSGNKRIESRVVSRSTFHCAVLKARKRINSGDDSKRVPPVPIPNTEVKPLNADGT